MLCRTCCLDVIIVPPNDNIRRHKQVDAQSEFSRVFDSPLAGTSRRSRTGALETKIRKAFQASNEPDDHLLLDHDKRYKVRTSY